MDMEIAVQHLADATRRAAAIVPPARRARRENLDRRRFLPPFFRAAAKTELGREKPRRWQNPVGGREKPPPAGRPAVRACLVVANYTHRGVGKTAAGGQNRSIATPARGPAPAKERYRRNVQISYDRYSPQPSLATRINNHVHTHQNTLRGTSAQSKSSIRSPSLRFLLLFLSPLRRPSSARRARVRIVFSPSQPNAKELCMLRCRMYAASWLRVSSPPIIICCCCRCGGTREKP